MVIPTRRKKEGNRWVKEYEPGSESTVPETVLAGKSKENDTLQAELSAQQEGCVRVAADFDNPQRRTIMNRSGDLIQRISKSTMYKGEVAHDTGFQSLTHFNRMFRRIVGQSPTAYREAKTIKQLLH